MAFFASKIAPSHGKINCIASGTIMGLVDKKDEYEESSSRSPMISLFTDSTLLHALHLASTSGMAS
jgi:hypothetical protein